MDTAAEEADRAKRAREDDPDAPPERGAPAPRLDDATGPADAPAATDSMSVDGAQPQPELGRPGASGSEGASQTRRESAGATSAWPRREPRVGPRYQVDARWLDAARADDPAPCDDAAAAAPQSGGEGGAAADKYGHIPSLARPTPLVLVPQLGDSQTQSDEKRRAQGDFSRAGQPDRKPPERLPIALGIGANLIGRSRTTRIVDTQLSRQHMMVTLYLPPPYVASDDAVAAAAVAGDASDGHRDGAPGGGGGEVSPEHFQIQVTALFSTPHVIQVNGAPFVSRCEPRRIRIGDTVSLWHSMYAYEVRFRCVFGGCACAGAWRDFPRAPRSQLCKNPDVAAEARQQARVAADKEERAREAKGDGAGHGQGRHPDAEGGESAGYGRLYDRVWAPPPAAGPLDDRALESFLDDQPLGWHEPSLHALYATRYNVEAAKKLSRRNGYAAAHGSPIVPWPREDTVRFAEVCNRARAR